MNKFLLCNISQLIAISDDQGLPLRGKKQNELNVISDGCVAVNNGKIEDFGKENEILQKYYNYPCFDACRNIVMPAFIDPHTHLIFAGSREEEFLCRLQGESYLNTLEKGYGIFTTVKATQEATEEELYQLALTRIHLMQKHGTVGLEIKSGYGLGFETEKKMLKVATRIKNNLDIPICRTYLAAHALPKEYLEKREKYIDLICHEMIPSVVTDELADCIDVFCEEGVFSTEESFRILSTGKKWGLKPKIHVDEFVSIGGLRVAADLNVLSADHLIMSKREELMEFGLKQGVAVVLPGTSFAIKIEDITYPRKIIDLNIPLAIGTDFNPGTCMCYSMQMMMELSVLKQGLTIEEAINASTINAAFAVGLNHITGSIKIGKRADLALFSVDDYKKLPYIWGTNKLRQLFIAGKSVNFA